MSKKSTEERALEATKKWRDGLVEAVGEQRAEELWELFPTFLYEQIEAAGEKEAVEWDITLVKQYFYDCRVKDWGNPTIQNKFGKDPETGEPNEFRDDKVMIKCTGGKNVVEDHQWYRNMPFAMKEMMGKSSTWKQWAREMVKQGVLTDEEFEKMVRSPLLLRPGVSYEPIEKEVERKEEKVKRISIEFTNDQQE